jgi:hypothetical protein
MTSTTFIDPPDETFTPPGTLRISQAAVALAREFREHARRAAPDQDWVISFDWADSRRVREKGTNDWREVGSGLDLTAYQRDKVKNEFVETIDDIDFAMRVPRSIWETSNQRLIDTDPAAFSGLTLR